MGPNQEVKDITLQDIAPTKIKNDTQEIHGEKYRKNLIISTCIIVISIIISVFAYFYDKYIIDYGKGNETTHEKIFQGIEKTKKLIYTNVLRKEYDIETKIISLEGENGIQNLSNTINARNGYVQKKETIKNSLPSLLNTIVGNAESLNESQKAISSNSFFPKELGNIISDDEKITSIQDSLTALEGIKFNSAINVFYHLDTFVENISKEYGISKNEIKSKMKDIINRGEKDINLYIKNCYLNAYELNYDCNNIGDFDKYYNITQDDFDTKFFKSLMKFIDSKLEQEEIPSFSITFKGFNQNDKKLTFNIEINTFKEDEMELAKEGILSPHLFILNNLVNGLKLSRSIVSEDIEIKSLDVSQKTITIGITEFTINTSNKSFSVSVKNSNSIDIDDYEY